jgi:photosystem II stability/assembly factor-like uncharacterized protein
MKHTIASRVRTYVVLVVLAIASATPATVGAGTGGKDAVVDNLYAVKSVSAQEAWVVGAFGVVFHTDDGGVSWQPQASQTSEQLFSVDFVDAKRGWIVGRSGTILHTENGGGSWTRQQSPTDKHLFSVDFADGDTGIAVGDWGAVVVTNDGGKTWREQSLTQDVILNQVQMLDRSRAWVVGEVGAVLYTEDGGASWSERKPAVEKTLFGVAFTDASHGWVVGLDGLIIRTEDGGQTWQLQHGSSEVAELEQVQFSQSVENPSLYAVALSGARGYVVGDGGAIFVSEDGGQSWKRQATPRDWGMSWLRSLSVVPGTHGAIVGADGLRVMIANGEIGLPNEEPHAAQASD